MSTPSLKKLWEAQFENSNSQLTKEAAAYGMNTQQYLEKIAELKVAQEQELVKLAQFNFDRGQIIGDGIKKGIAAELAKFASAGGDVHAAQKLRNLFCE